ncbi:hypothetical protein KIN20_019086 [Parelaphostrongylus tenuis]|uniref:Uncharacterized protein n=1 Tax=Parelaphostrongylus tenuis TaxID=148309 RepID=A0AAD5N2Q6_PARTN|nr:hypothetical protein KIN20_019086 [Parelaphostrongylus tenuis]
MGNKSANVQRLQQKSETDYTSDQYCRLTVKWVKKPNFPISVCGPKLVKDGQKVSNIDTGRETIICILHRHNNNVTEETKCE